MTGPSSMRATVLTGMFRHKIWWNLLWIVRNAALIRTRSEPVRNDTITDYLLGNELYRTPRAYCELSFRAAR